MSQLVKVVFTVPVADADKLRKAVGNADGGQIGNYTHCSFSIRGVGRFLPKDGAHPAIGEVGKPEKVIEERVEVTCEQEKLKNIVQVIRDNHPYEEPAIDIYPMLLED